MQNEYGQKNESQNKYGQRMNLNAK